MKLLKNSFIHYSLFLAIIKHSSINQITTIQFFKSIEYKFISYEIQMLSYYYPYNNKNKYDNNEDIGYIVL